MCGGELDTSDVIAITGMGMASSLGLDVINACAAARAGLSRARPLSFQVTSREDNTQEHVNGHPIASMTEGFEGVGRILRIVQLGMADFDASVEPDLLRSEKRGCLLALPHGRQCRQDDEEGQSRESAWKLDPQQVRAALRRFGETGFEDNHLALFSDGHTSFVEAVREAMRLLNGRALVRCVVGAADSLLDPDTLQCLHHQKRLKTSDAAVGVQPGEAGAFFLLEPLATAQRRGATVLGVITGLSVGRDDHNDQPKKPPNGRALAHIIDELSGRLDNQSVPWLISDQNGEPDRAAEWGCTWTRIVGDHPVFRTTHLSYPAISFGETRMAGSALGLCMALRAFARGYAPAPRALILSSSDDGSRAGLMVQASHPG